jgi:hypothetical protein|tara:strand:- start:240 stop:413 length:174 start_codon:yes stop_codon:yes gene_type:complete
LKKEKTSKNKELNKLYMLLKKLPPLEKCTIKSKKEWMEELKISSKEFDSLLKDSYFK